MTKVPHGELLASIVRCAIFNDCTDGQQLYFALGTDPGIEERGDFISLLEGCADCGILEFVRDVGARKVRAITSLGICCYERIFGLNMKNYMNYFLSYQALRGNHSCRVLGAEINIRNPQHRHELLAILSELDFAWVDPPEIECTIPTDLMGRYGFQGVITFVVEEKCEREVNDVLEYFFSFREDKQKIDYVWRESAAKAVIARDRVFFENLCEALDD